MKTLPRIGIVLVSYGHEDSILEIVKKLSLQMHDDDKIAVVDNKPDNNLRKIISKKVDYFNELNNPGFAAGCNHGARAIQDQVDILFFINPDTFPSNNVLDVVRSEFNKGYAAWMPLLELPDGKVNSAGNVVHISGLSWCSGYLEEKKLHRDHKEIHDISGACMAIDVKWWIKLDGISEDYFLYYEDTDISSRIRLMGGKLSLVPDASVIHDYEYSKGDYKWFYIERNKYIFMLRNWPTSVLVVLFPLLLICEIGLLGVALLDKRLTLKLKSTFSFVKLLPKILISRKKVQATRTISSYEYMKNLVYELDTPLFGPLLRNKLSKYFFGTYYKIALFLLKPRA